MRIPPPPTDYEKRMPRYDEADRLCFVGNDVFGREVRLAAGTSDAWLEMFRCAEQDGVHLLLLSGFRSIGRQSEIVEKKIESGLTLDVILRVSAYPGFSEHHTGRAVDIGSPDCPHFSEEFEKTREFVWMNRNAARHGFLLSYPRGNQHGIAYEPWHWCMKEKRAA